MSFFDCIQQAVDEKVIQGGKAKRAHDLYSGFKEQGLDDATASARVLETITGEVKTKKVKNVLAAKKYQDARDAIFQQKDIRGRLNPNDAIRDIISSPTGHGNVISVESTGNAIMGASLRKMENVLHEHRPVLVNFIRKMKTKKSIDDFVSELDGVSTNNKVAKEFKDAWQEATEYQRELANINGANIKKDDLFLPSAHDSKQIALVGQKKWVDDLSNNGNVRIDVQVKDVRTGNYIDANTAQGRKILEESWKTLKSSGKYSESIANIAESMSKERIIKFKDAKSWQNYHNMYGRHKDDLYATMIDHLQNTSRKLGLMQVLGDNPTGAFNKLRKDVLSHAKEQSDKMTESSRKNFMKEAESALEKAKKEFNLVSSNVSIISDSLESTTRVLGDMVKGREDFSISRLAATGTASLFSNARDFVGATKLGKTVLLGSVGDMVNMIRTAHMRGLPQMKMISRAVKALNPLSVTDQKKAARWGVTQTHWLKKSFARERMFGEVSSTGMMSYMFDFTARGTGMSAQPQVYKNTMAIEFMGVMGDHSKIKYGSLPKEMKDVFEINGINEKDWDLLRTSAREGDDRAEWLVPANLLENERIPFEQRNETYFKFSQAIENTVQRPSVVEPTARVRALLGKADAPKGSYADVILSSASMFGTYPLAFYQSIMRPALHSNNRLAHLAYLMVGGTMAMALYMQTREVLDGKTPRNMDDPKFWTEAFLRTDALPIVGNFLNEVWQGRTGGETPIGGVIKQGKGILSNVMNGEFEKAKDKSTMFLIKNNPLATMWQSSAVWNSLVTNEVQKAVDPKAYKRKLRSRQKRMRERGQEELF
jgi:hypothetical protein